MVTMARYVIANVKKKKSFELPKSEHAKFKWKGCMTNKHRAMHKVKKKSSHKKKLAFQSNHRLD